MANVTLKCIENGDELNVTKKVFASVEEAREEMRREYEGVINMWIDNEVVSNRDCVSKQIDATSAYAFDGYMVEMTWSITVDGELENGDVRHHKDGCKASYGNQALSIETALGSLVVYTNGDPGVYDEFSIDLVGKDGRVLQVAVVGVEEPSDCNDGPELHVYAWNGLEEDVASTTVLTVNENSYWYE